MKLHYTMYALIISLLGMAPIAQGQMNIETQYGPEVKDRVHTDLAEALSAPEKVFRLDLSNQDLKEFPEEILAFKNLEELSLKGNAIWIIDIKGNALPNLTWFNASENKLGKFSLGPNVAPRLENLYLNFNQLPKLPELSSEHRLRILDVRYNRISTLEAHGYLSQLVRYYLDGNPLSNVALSFTASPGLKLLSMAEIELSSFPEVSMLSLEDLNLSNCKLQSFKATTASLPRLRFLDVSSNPALDAAQLEHITTFKKLIYLNLDHCALNALPASIKNLKRLQAFSAIDNNLEALPEVFYSMRLQKINLDRNPLTETTATQLRTAFEGRELNL